MFATLLLIVPGIFLLRILYPKQGFWDLLPAAPALGTVIYYLINILAYQNTVWKFDEITGVYVSGSVIILALYLYRYRPGPGQIRKTLKKLLFNPLLLGLFLGLYFLLTFWPPFGWDTVTLHDFRAKLIMDRVSFTQMLQLSQSDSYNPSYYLSYPPLVSFVHAFYYRLGTNPVIFDFFVHLSIVLAMFTLIRIRSSKTMAILITAPFALTPVFINHISLGYTNLLYAYFYLVSLYLVTHLCRFRTGLRDILLLALFAAGMRLTRWVEPFYLIPLVTAVLFSLDRLGRKVINLAFGLLTVYVLNFHWSSFLSKVPPLFIDGGLQHNLSLLSAGLSYAFKASNLFWSGLWTFWPLLVTYLFLSVYLLHRHPARIQRFLALNTVFTLGLMYVGSVFVYLQLPGRPEIFDSLNRLPMFLLPVVWTSLGLLIV